MRIDKPRANLISADIYYFIRILFYAFIYLYYAVVLYKNITGERPSAGTIIYCSAFEQCSH